MAKATAPRSDRKRRRYCPPPLQDRSHRTLQRILDATQALLEEHDFDSLSVGKIARKAGCSVGGFYGRLRDKEALLQALDERYVERFAEELEAAWAEAQAAGRAPAAMIVDTIRLLVGFHRRHRGLVRTLVLRARRPPDRRYREREQRLHALMPRFGGLLLAHHASLSHPDPGRAVIVGPAIVFFALREMVLWEHLGAIVGLGDEELVGELARALLAYLGMPSGAAAKKAQRALESKPIEPMGKPGMGRSPARDSK